MEDSTEKPKWEFLKIGLDPEDMELLGQLVAAEKLTRADIIRRAIREFAKAHLNEQQHVA
jgi:hypothetical protein